MSEGYDDRPQWYWACASSSTRVDDGEFDLAGDRFVVACGKLELNSRIRLEIDPSGRCAWDKFGPKDGKATLADCMPVFLTAREVYGASYNRLVLEMARVPSFASFIHDAGSDLCNWVSNPVTRSPLPQEPYDAKVEDRLGPLIEATLHLPTVDHLG